MSTYGVTAAGFVAKPLAAILSDIDADQLATMDPGIDLSPTGPQGQQNGIMANVFAQLWELAGVCYNSFNRQATEGAGLDNIGDLVAILRETEDYTQVECTLTISAGDAPYAPGSLVANVAGNATLTFSNLEQVSAGDISGGSATVLFQAQLPGATPTINPGTLTVITNPVTGWTAITNPASQTSLGDNAELDANYASRQEEELAVDGSCNPPATIAALLALGAAQSPPVNLMATVYENTSYLPLDLGDITLPPHTYAVVVYDTTSPTPFVMTQAGAQAIGEVIWKNKPAGIQSYAPPIDATWNLVQNTPEATASASMTAILAAGDALSFASQPGAIYTVSAVAGTLVILTQNYTGPTESATTAVGGGGVVEIVDEYLGDQLVYYNIPTPVPLYVDITLVVRPNFDFNAVASSVQTALVAAAIAPTPADGVPPNGQLAPGADVIGSQLSSVIMAVAGVYDVQSLTFGTAPSPGGSSPIVVPALQVATLVADNITVTEGSPP